MPLRALCIDFNSYFASVEQQESPALRGKPVAVAPMLADTTCAIAASYPAKKFGVKTGTRIGDARRLCPGLIVVPARPGVYVEYHNRCLEAIEACLPLGDVLSIDEVVCELPPEFRTRTAAAALAHRIKDTIRARVGICLTSSIGIAPNGLLAKVASDMMKPDGLVILDDADLPGRLLDLVPRDISGIGERMEQRLRARGIHTFQDLWDASAETLRLAWGGVEGERFHRRLHGEDLPWEDTHRSTISHEHVLAPAERTEAQALGVLQRLLQKAAARLRRLGYFSTVLSLSLRYTDKTRWGDDLRTDETQDTLELLRALATLWERRPRTPHRTPLKVGVTLSSLLPASAHTPSLFHGNGDARTGLNRAIDSLNERLGKNTVYFGGAHAALGSAPTRIAFNHIPDAQETREDVVDNGAAAPPTGAGAVPPVRELIVECDPDAAPPDDTSPPPPPRPPRPGRVTRATPNARRGPR